MKGDINPDRIFRDGLKFHEVDPPENMWNSIEAALPPERKPLAAFFLKWGFGLFLAAVAVSLGVIAYGLWDLQKDMAVLDQKLQAVEKPTEKLSEEPNPNGSKGSLANQETRQVESTENGIEDTSEASVTQETNPQLPQELKPLKSDGEQTKAESLVSAKSTTPAKSIAQTDHPEPHSDYIETMSSMDIALDGELINLETDLMQMPSLGASLTFGEKPLLENTERSVDISKDKLVWIFGLSGIVNLNNRRLVGQNSRGDSLADYLRNIENIPVTYGAEVSISVEHPSNFRLSTGLKYSTWCRKANYALELSPNEEGFQSGPNNALGDFSVVRELQGSTGNQLITVEGNAILLETSTELASGEPLPFSVEVEECFELISIPISLEYAWKKDRWAILPAVGLEIDRVISKSTMVSSTTGFETIENREIRSTKDNFLSYTFGLDIGYSLGTHLDLRLGARYKSWISPLYESEFIQTRPTLYSGRIGLFYTFPERRL